jgi:homogentisate phytyltransferase/homogentisate geranylgeranyltransferase
MLLNSVIGGLSLVSFAMVMLMNDLSFAFQSRAVPSRHFGSFAINVKHRGDPYPMSAFSNASTATATARYALRNGIQSDRSLSSSSNYPNNHNRCKKSQLGVADVTAGISAGDEPSDEKSAYAQKKKDAFPIVLWRFTRPHTLIGSALAIPALHILAAPTYTQAFSSAAATSTLFAMIPSLLMNLYITGLNQITDVEIDKINKPNLPIAAGDLSLGIANVIVLLSLIVSIAMGMVSSTPGSQGLNVALWGSGILGTMYSLPPFRLKRFPFLAAFCIVAVRGAVINAGFFAHAMTAAYGVETTVLDCLRSNMRCLLSSLFFAVFGIVIGELVSLHIAVARVVYNFDSFSHIAYQHCHTKHHVRIH